MHYDILTSDLIQRAAQLARSLGHSYVGSAHLLLVMAREPGVAGQTLRLLGMDPDLTEAMARLLYGQGTPELPLPQGLTGESRELLRGAAREAKHLGSRENILKAKLELADALPDGATLLLCDDNDLLQTVDIPRLHVVRYGLNSPRAEIKATIVSATPLSTNFMLHAEGQSWRATIPGTGEHLVLNALAAFGAGRAMGIPAETAIEALKNYTPSGQRQKVVEHEGITMVEDCYNASPDSMRAAIKTLGRFPCDGRRIFVAADMLELGDISEDAHRRVGRWTVENGVDFVLTYGPQAAYIADEAAKLGGKSKHCADRQEAADALRLMASAGDIILLKGSHSMQVDKMLELFK